MTDSTAQPFYSRLSTIFFNTVDAVVTNIRNTLNNDSIETKTQPTLILNTNDTQGLREIQMPQTRTGLGSNEGELIIMVKKYLEIVGLVFFVWLLGYFHFSVSWILLFVFIYLFRQRQRAQSRQRYLMLGQINNNEEQYIKARLDELPSWVFFPDVERAEWINRILKQIWPYANRYLDKNIFRDILVPLIQGTLPALSDFSFQKLDLGETPPRIGGIKVYSDNVRDQVMMDVEVSYAGDACVKAKLKGIVCGIKDIQFVGEVRIVLSPLINTIPLIGAVTFFFLKKPNINFKLTDAGTLVDIPGLNDLMLGQINDIVSSMLVLPNRQVIPLVSDIPIAHLRWSNPEGVVRVFIIKAQDLIKADINLLGKGKSDPFVRVKAQGNVEYKTKVINNTTKPEWNEVFEFAVEHYESDSIQFEVYDEDPGKDDFIGRSDFPLNSLIGQDAVDTWLTLKDVKSGSLNVSLQYFSLTTNKSSIETMERINNSMMKRDKLSKALLVCYIDRCSNLPASRKTRREPNPFCRIRVEGTEAKTQTFDSQTNPQFEHVSQILVANPLHEKLKIEICDARSNNDTIAYFEIPIRQIFDAPTMTIESQSYPLKSLNEPLDRATIVLRLSLFILSPGRSTEHRLGSPPSSPLTNNAQTFESLSTPQTNMKRSLTNESSFRTSIEDNVGTKSISTALPFRTTPSDRLSVDSRTKPERKSLVIADDPDLKSARFGTINLGINYQIDRNCLSIKIHSCKNLINVHEHNLPDPYVRLYLLPDFRKDKRKTKPIHDKLNPIYNDLFEWTALLADIRRQILFISVKNNSPLFAQEQTYMGELQIDLSNVDPEKSSNAWYALQEPNTSGATILKIKYDT